MKKSVEKNMIFFLPPLFKHSPSLYVMKEEKNWACWEKFLTETCMSRAGTFTTPFISFMKFTSRTVWCTISVLYTITLLYRVSNSPPKKKSS